MEARQIRVSGRVQGVGYRASLQEEASRRGVTGWVRNRSDGTVEALLQGPQAAVEAVIAWARRGPPGARVDGVSETAAQSDAAHARFAVRPTE
jgi:acylphosphatase